MSRFRAVLNLRRLDARDRRAVMIGLAVLVPALLYSGAVRPYRAALSDLRDRAAAERALLAREEALIASALTVPGNVEAAHTRALAAGQRLVRASNMPLAEAEVTGMLENVAAMSRVLLLEMRAVEARNRAIDDVAPSLRALRLAVRGESDLEGVLTFLHRIESNPLLLRIVELSMEPVYEGSARSGDRRNTGVMQFTITVEAFAPAGEVAS